MIVLHERDLVPHRVVEGPLVEALHEETARIAEHFRFKDEHAVDGGGDHVHGVRRPSAILRRSSGSALAGSETAARHERRINTAAIRMMPPASVAPSAMKSRLGLLFFSGGVAVSTTWIRPPSRLSSTRASSYCLANRSNSVSWYLNSRYLLT